MREIFVVPVPGARVHRPDDPKRLIASDGETVPRTAYVLERLREGDLVEGVIMPEPSSRAASRKKAGAE